jgi:TIR domain/Pentapeptide repeats (8 copies)
MAHQEQVERLIRSVDEWNEWRREKPEIRPDLSNADFSGAYLSGANLSGAYLFWATLNSANLFEADLRQAYLNRAYLFKADLRGTNLSEANLRRARLNGADLSYANLTEANFTRADLSYANLTEADLTETDFTESHFFRTTFAWVDLSNVKGLDTATHRGSSTVNINSVILPDDEDIRLLFLRGIGFSDTLIDYLPSLLNIPTQYHSLFLSHSHHDEDFARQLYNDLQNQGVRCWFVPHDLHPGIPIVRGIKDAIQLHEKLLLILSTHVIESNWVQQEVETVLRKEATTGQEILLPIGLDNAILESEILWAQHLCHRHISDFTGWQDEATYQQAFSALLQRLEVIKLPTSTIQVKTTSIAINTDHVKST